MMFAIVYAMDKMRKQGVFSEIEGDGLRGHWN